MKQEDITMLLCINKRQWAMYKIGQRDLPLDAQLKLVDMLAFRYCASTSSVSKYLYSFFENKSVEEL